MQVIKGIKKRPRKVLLYGTHGIGKTTWAAQAGNVIVLATEDGQGDVGCDRTPVLRDLGSVNAWLSDLGAQPHDYRWVAIDTLDWLERLIFKAVCEVKGKANIDDIGYAKGREFALTHWDYILRSLEHLIASRNMGVILLAHSRIVKVEEPELDSYNKYEPDLDKRSCGMLQEWCDEVLFARYRVNTLKSDEGFNRERTRVIGQPGDRLVYTCEGPGYFAKRRIPMPDAMPLDFGHYLAYIKQAYGGARPAGVPPATLTPAAPPASATPPTETAAPAPSTPPTAASALAAQWEERNPGANIAGLINDGSSKMPSPEWATE